GAVAEQGEPPLRAFCAVGAASRRRGDRCAPPLARTLPGLDRDQVVPAREVEVRRALRQAALGEHLVEAGGVLALRPEQVGVGPDGPVPRVGSPRHAPNYRDWSTYCRGWVPGPCSSGPPGSSRRA